MGHPRPVSVSGSTYNVIAARWAKYAGNATPNTCIWVKEPNEKLGTGA
jgi:hypothetical protein